MSMQVLASGCYQKASEKQRGKGISTHCMKEGEEKAIHSQQPHIPIPSRAMLLPLPPHSLVAELLGGSKFKGEVFLTSFV